VVWYGGVWYPSGCLWICAACKVLQQTMAELTNGQLVLVYLIFTFQLFFLCFLSWECVWMVGSTQLSPNNGVHCAIYPAPVFLQCSRFSSVGFGSVGFGFGLVWLLGPSEFSPVCFDF